MRDYRPYIPQSIGELLDQLASMMLSKATFKDDTGYFPDMSIETEFVALNGGLDNLRNQIGEDHYIQLAALSDQMRAHFEADPQERTGEAREARAIILQMRDLLTQLGQNET